MAQDLEHTDDLIADAVVFFTVFTFASPTSPNMITISDPMNSHAVG
ncbi:hypothetical protein [Neorhizobium tomejilense]|nr:hypothetical protein [Neorhizobium tomejilense]